MFRKQLILLQKGIKKYLNIFWFSRFFQKRHKKDPSLPNGSTNKKHALVRYCQCIKMYHLSYQTSLSDGYYYTDLLNVSTITTSSCVKFSWLVYICCFKHTVICLEKNITFFTLLLCKCSRK